MDAFLSSIPCCTLPLMLMVLIGPPAPSLAKPAPFPFPLISLPTLPSPIPARLTQLSIPLAQLLLGEIMFVGLVSARPVQVQEEK